MSKAKKKTAKKWYVDIIETKTGNVENSIPCDSEGDADIIERGANINLYHEKFHTEVNKR